MLLPCKETEWTLGFYQLRELCREEQRHCLLDICCLQSTSRQCTLVYSNTAGSVVGFKADLQDDSPARKLFALSMNVQNPVTLNTGVCAANSISPVTRDRLAVGGDDGGLRLADLTRGIWITSSTKHFAAVVKVIGLPNGEHLLSLGADNLLFLWKLENSLDLTVLSEFTMSGLGDPQDLAVIPFHSGYLAMVSGSGLQLCYVCSL